MRPCDYHEKHEGCEYCCERCYYNTHNCPLCGDDLDHGVEVCRRCLVERGQTLLSDEPNADRGYPR